MADQSKFLDYPGLSRFYDNLKGKYATKNELKNIDADTITTTALTVSGYANIEQLVVPHLYSNDQHTEYIDAEKADITYASIENLTATNQAVSNLTARTVTVEGNLTAAQADITTLKAADVNITGRLDAAEGNITTLTADNVTINEKLTAAEADITTLTADTATINGKLTAAEADITALEAKTAVIDTLDTTYAQIDLANVNNAWIQNGVVKDASIADAKIIGVSANKLTAGTIDASNITVTNLNASNITTGTLNGQRIGTGSLSLDKLSEDVYTEAEVDAKLATMQDEIDGAIETFTGSVVPTLNNYPASSWSDADTRSKHVGDVYYVVNAGNQADGYCYRFAYDNSTSTYSWVLIKDSDVTAALQRLLDAEGDISGLQSFQSTTSAWITDTDEELSSLKTNHTTLATVVDKTLVSTTQLWYTKANTTAPNKPTAHVTSTSTDGNAWRTVVPAYNSSYPNYFYCYEWQYADGTYGWSDVTRDIGMGETQSTARTASSNASTALTNANSAVSTANTANTNASNAVNTANNADSNASTALTNANKSIVTDTLHYLATSASSGVTTSTSGWTTTVQAVTATKKYLWTYHTYTKASGGTTNTDPCITGVYGDKGEQGIQGVQGEQGIQGIQGVQGEKGEKGDTGVGITSITEYYARNNSTTAPADSSFGTSVLAPTSSQKYVWNYELITYTDTTTQKTNKHIVATYGETGSTGKGISSIVDYYAKSSSATAPADSSFGTTVVTVDATNKYLWNYELITYTDSTTAKTDKRIIGVYGDKGEQGIQGIQGIQGEKGDTGDTGDTGVSVTASKPVYWCTNSTTAPTINTSTPISSSATYNGWSYAISTWTTTYKYIFTCDEITYSDGSKTFSTVIRNLALESANSTASTANTNASSAVSTANTANTNAQAAQTTANANIKSTVQLWFTKADTTAPSKPTAHVTTNNASTANEWNIAVPTYNATYPNYFYCYEYQKGDNTYSWSDVVLDRATTENQANARSALSQVATKVETSVFNTVSQQVDTNTANITSLSNTVETKADSSTVTTLSNTVNSVQQTANSNTSKISNLTTRLGTNADGTAGTSDIVAKEAALEQDLSGFKTTVSSTYATQANLNTEINQRKAMYGTSSTAAGTTAKAVTCANFALYTGARVAVTFSNANTATVPTLNVNSTGAKTIKSFSGAALTEAEYKWAAGSTLEFIYDGTNWRLADEGTLKRLNAAEGTLSTHTTTIEQNTNAIALKANATDVYTKTKTDELISKEVTDRDAAITASADAINLSVSQNYTTKTEFNNLEVGGRNLFRESGMLGKTTLPDNIYTPFVTDYVRLYNSPSSYTITKYDDSANQIEITLNNSSNLGIAFARLASDMGLDSSSYYTISCWAKCTKANATLAIGLSYYNTSNSWVWRGGTNQKPFSATDTWQKFTLTFKPDADTKGICYCFTCSHGTSGGTDKLYLRQCKLEKGNKATDWTPAPEDMEAYADSAVSTAKTEIKQTTDNISLEVSKKVGASEVISKINQSPESITINADRVNIEGAAIFSSGRLSTTSLNNAYDAKGAASTAQTNAINSANSTTDTKLANYSTTSQMNTAISTAVDNIEVGGRNLLLGTGGSDYTKVRTADMTNSISSNLAISMSNGEITMNPGTATTSEKFFRFLSPTQGNMHGLIPGETYTLSCYVKGSLGSGAYVVARSQWCTTGGWIGGSVPRMSISSEYVFFTTTETIPSDATAYYTSFQIYDTTTDTTVYIKNLKLEKGTKATDWTPAPEDLNVQEQRIYYKTTATTAPAAPTTWVEETGTAALTWTTKRMPYDQTNKYLYTCTQRQAVGGGITNSTVLLDDTTTVIDGGNIITGTVTANALNASDINATGRLTVGALSSAAQSQVLNSEIASDIDDAAKTATSYIVANSTGLMIANMIGSEGQVTPSGITSGRNVIITPNSVDIRNGQTVLASYGDSITIGNNSNYQITIDPTNGLKIGSNVQIDTSGDASFSGSITSTSGKIGGWNILSTCFDSYTLNGAASDSSSYDTRVYFGNGTSTNKDILFVNLHTSSTDNYPIILRANGFFRLYDPNGTAYMTFDPSATNVLTINGHITATTGKIGVFNLNSALYTTTNAFGTTANNIYIGSSGISLGTTFKVTAAGALTATSGTIGGWTIDGTNGITRTGASSKVTLSSTGEIKIEAGVYNTSGTWVTAGTTTITGQHIVSTTQTTNVYAYFNYNVNYIGYAYTTSSSITPRAVLCPDGRIYASSEICSNAPLSNGGNFRAISGNYGTIFRNDSSNFYILLTDSGNATGTWNSLRPLFISLSTGAVSSASNWDVYSSANKTFNIRSTGGTADLNITTASSREARVTVNNGVHAGKFQSSSGNNLGIYDNTNSKWVVYSNSSGTVTVNTSDRRAKNYIQDTAQDSAIDLLRSIKIRQFTYKDDEHGVITNGIFAQDIRDYLISKNMGYRSYLNIQGANEDEEVYYDLTVDEDKVQYGLEYQKFVPELWLGWQYHDDEIATLKAENERLRKRIEMVELLLLKNNIKFN